MNDIINSSKVFDFHLFADDSNLFCTNKSILDMKQVVNNNIVNINSWLNCNKLSLNIDKTNFVIFHPPQKKITSTIKIFINQVQIKQETSLKYLGIYIDCNLNWKSHIQHISKKINWNVVQTSPFCYPTCNYTILLFLNLPIFDIWNNVVGKHLYFKS